MKRRLLISGKLRIKFGMDVGSKSKQTIFHKNLQNIKLSGKKFTFMF